jgi:hypothetical protein
VRVYVGQTRSRKLIAELVALRIGECTCRGELPPRRTPWFYDNGAFKDWTVGRSFDAAAFERDFALLGRGPLSPDFVVCPDLVAGGTRSLEFSLAWVSGLRSQRPDLRYYLAVQDGMTELDVAAVIHLFDGVFVGGSLPWKIATGAAWVQFAHASSLPCHVGRVGTAKRVAWAIRIGVDSIDSSLPLWSKENMRSFIAALESRQLELL